MPLDKRRTRKIDDENTDQEDSTRDRSRLVDRVKKSVKRNMIQELSAIGSIAVKIGIPPNKLAQMYKDIDGIVNVKLMVKEFDNGKGLKNMQDKVQEQERQQNHNKEKWCSRIMESESGLTR